MEGFKKTTFAKVGSWLLALAIVVTSITLPQSAVNAETVSSEDVTVITAESASGNSTTELENTKFTLYYYCADMTDEDVLYLNIWNWNSLAFQDSTPQDKYIDCSNWQGKFVEVSGNPGWYSIDMSLKESTGDDGITIYKTNSDTKVYEIDNKYNATSQYESITSGKYTAYAIKGADLYTDLTAAGLDFNDDKPYTINVYENDFSADSALDDFTQSGTDGVDEVLVKSEAWHFWSNSTVTTVKATHEVTGLGAGDYYLSFTAQGGDMTESTAKISAGSSSQQVTISYGNWGTPTTNNTEILTLSEDSNITIEMNYGLAAGSWCDIDDLKLVKKVDTVEKATYEFNKLTEMIAECEAMDSSEYSEATWSNLQNVLTEAKKLTGSSSVEDIMAAQVAIKTAKASLKDAGVWVKKVEGLSEDFICGVDISSYVSVTESGATFKDEDGNVLDDKGFFTLLKNSGINYVRVRVWNDPYTVSGNGYGGGNNDLEKAKIIGKLATDAGMGVLIDFHYSDFWADPERQYAPKAWKNMDLSEKETALYDYTLDSLNELKAAGVNVTMVQVGNETNNGIAGEDRNNGDWTNMCTLFSAGSRAVRAFDPDVLVAVHFTDPQTIGNFDKIAKQLDDHSVDYDIFASSYYPNIHGSMENITNVLKKIADTYGKKVMVAETAWANTTNDGDGHSQSFNVGSDPDYTISVQGQANVIRDVVQAVHNIGNAGIGVFVWEPTWIPVQYAYDEEGKLIDSIYQSNKNAWEQYGSGWASSYSNEYDPEHGGKYYGGSVKDSEAFFDFNGNPLASLTIFNDVYTGRTGPSVKVEVVKHATVEVLSGNVEEAVKTMALPATVTAIYNNSDRKEISVTWDKTELNQIADFGSYSIKGTASLENGETAAAVCDITILPDTLLEQGDFEEGHDKWEIAGTQKADLVWNDTPYRGEGAMHFWSGEPFDFTLTQSVKVQKSGSYKASMVIQGKDETESDDITIQVTNNSSKISKNAKASLKGWKDWDKAVTDEIEAKAGETLTVVIRVKAGAGAWGSLDDVFLYMTKASAADLEPEKPEKKIESFTKPSVTVEVGKTIEMPKTVKVTYNDKTSEDVSVTWNAAEVTAVQAKAASEEGVGTYTVNGELKDGTKVTCEVKIVAGDKPAEPETPAESEPAPADKGTKLATTTGSFQVTTTDSAATPEVVFTAPKNKKATTVTIPASIKDENGVSYKVTSIAAKAFQNNKKIKTVKLGSNIKSVGKNAFKGCTNLKKVTFDKNLEKINSSAFSGCTKLTSVTIPAGVKEIGSNAFYGCKNLKKITIQSTVLKKVGSKALKGIHKNAVIKVPSKKLSAYKKLLKNKGQASTVQIKK